MFFKAILIRVLYFGDTMHKNPSGRKGMRDKTGVYPFFETAGTTRKALV
jgi:hypothetical protein